MDHMKKSILLVFVIGLIGAFYLNASEDALTLMSAPQKSTLEKLRSFDTHTSKADISNEFGEPLNNTLNDTTISWEVKQDSKVTRVKAYFLTGELNKVQFLSLDPFWGYTLYYSKNGVENEL